ncbi:hypothetical protein [Solidesulfovibrio carbinolicus]|uniref:hypothetical protein n=1 Tax=Solidesulfovibrio carbinolicus TaxID=296842 RepID=UPI0010139214|nr:hypothetical protein [Solidesulfovibrio carbinolicus]
MAFNNVSLLTIKVEDGGFVYNEALQEYVHLRQGDADGACGAYCLFMALLVGNLIDRNIVLNLETVDGRTRIGRLVNALGSNGDFLICTGLGVEDIVRAVQESFRACIALDVRDARGGSDVHIILAEVINNGSPFLLALTFVGGDRHWVLVIGYEADCDGKIAKFLVLDPSCDPSKISPWNGIIDLRDPAGPLPYKYCTGHEVDKVAIGEVLVVNPN